MDKFNVIGDIHGRTCWKELVDEECVNIFVGDYVSPYEVISFEDVKKNLLEIIQYKREHPETILLIGNHDEDHWHICERYSRQDTKHVPDYQQIFGENKDCFQVAFATEHYLITHAGVTKPWTSDYFLKEIGVEPTPQLIADAVNNCWKRGFMNPFSFGNNCLRGDYYGSSPQQSCLWVRPETLQKYNIFRGTEYKQVVGHTQFKDITTCENLIFVDVLGSKTNSYKFIDNGRND